MYLSERVGRAEHVERCCGGCCHINQSAQRNCSIILTGSVSTLPSNNHTSKRPTVIITATTSPPPPIPHGPPLSPHPIPNLLPPRLPLVFFIPTPAPFRPRSPHRFYIRGLSGGGAETLGFTRYCPQYYIRSREEKGNEKKVGWDVRR